MRKIILWVLLCAFMLSTACQATGKGNLSSETGLQQEASEEIENEDTLIRIMMTYSGSGKAPIKSVRAAEKQTERINQYLLKAGKDYTVLIEVVPWKEGSSPPDVSGYDLVSTRRCPEDMPETFEDLAEELKNGRLKKVYESMPERYWQRLNINGSIYSLFSNMDPAVHSLVFEPQFKEALQEEQFDITQYSGKPLAEWGEALQKICEGMGTKGCMQSPIGGGGDSLICYANVWEAHFRLLLPYLGIDYAHPEKGVQCIYASEYAKEMQNFWEEIGAKGYLEGGADVENTITSVVRYDLEPVMNDEHFYVPLQKVSYVAPQVATNEYVQVAIPKTSQKKELVYRFLEDMVQNRELAELVAIQEDGSLYSYFLPSMLFWGEKGVLAYTGTYEENQERCQKRYAGARDAMLEGFVFDPQPVQAQAEAIQQFLMGGGYVGYIKETGWGYDWDGLVAHLYELGMQEVMDELNRQLEAYREDES